MRAILSLLAAFVLAAPLALASAPLVSNGGFDTPAGWTFSHVDGMGGRMTGGGNPGGYAVLNDAGQPHTDPTVTQTVSGLVPGHLYRVTFDFRNEHPGYGVPAALSFAVLVDGAPIAEFSNPGGAWTQNQVSFNAPASTIVLGFAGERNGDDTSYGLDNVVMDDITPASPAPELGTLLLVLAGLVGIAFVAARRG